MSNVAVNPDNVIARLSGQIGSLYAEVAMRDEALAQAHARISELEALAAEASEQDATA